MKLGSWEPQSQTAAPFHASTSVVLCSGTDLQRTTLVKHSCECLHEVLSELPGNRQASMSTYYCRTAQHGQAQPHGTWQWRAKSYTSFATTESHGSTRREHRNTRDRLAFTNHFVSNQSQAIILYWMHNCTKRQQSCMPGLAALQRANSSGYEQELCIGVATPCPCTAGPGLAACIGSE